MIIRNKLKKHQAEHILILIEQMTRAEIVARLSPLGYPEYADYQMISIEKKDELLEYIYGTSNLVVLGEQWNLLKDKKIRKSKNRKL